MAKKLNPKIIRVGDKVKIIKPLLFIRCGYEANIKEIVDFVCWLARATGAERKIYTKEDKSLEGEEYFVQAIMYVQTGIYNKGWYSYSNNPYNDDDVDYHPSFLENMKIHKILKLDQTWRWHCEELWIEAENVEKVYNKG